MIGTTGYTADTAAGNRGDRYHATGTESELLERRLPPIALAAVAALVLVAIGGVYMAAHMPRPVSLAPVVGTTVAGWVLFVSCEGMLASIKGFAWKTFFRIFLWAVLAYAVIGGMLEYIFILDHVRGTVLVILTATLVLFAVDIPLLMAFSVARYQPNE